MKSDGALVLGENISCDGFASDKKIRVQTHIHQDHMADFNTSKANQKIIVSEETHALLRAIYNADIPYRPNIIQLKYNEEFFCEKESIKIISSGHMLGSVQVLVTHADGYTVGYSSDFFWPLDNVIKCDELIVDATYGDSLRSRQFTQQNVDDCLIQLIGESISQGKATACIGHIGRLQGALHLVSDLIRWPILCSPRAQALATVFRSYGQAIPETILSTSNEAIIILQEKIPCFAFVTLPELRHLSWIARMRKITLSAYVCSISNPLVVYPNGDSNVSLTDHANFDGTIAYIRATGAKRVLTDPRSGNAQALASSVRDLLSIEAEQISIRKSAAWG